MKQLHFLTICSIKIISQENICKAYLLLSILFSHLTDPYIYPAARCQAQIQDAEASGHKRLEAHYQHTNNTELYSIARLLANINILYCMQSIFYQSYYHWAIGMELKINNVFNLSSNSLHRAKWNAMEFWAIVFANDRVICMWYSNL